MIGSAYGKHPDFAINTFDSAKQRNEPFSPIVPPYKCDDEILIIEAESLPDGLPPANTILRMETLCIHAVGYYYQFLRVHAVMTLDVAFDTMRDGNNRARRGLRHAVPDPIA